MKHSTQTSTLPNGIELLFIDVPRTKNFELVISINAGYRTATKDNPVLYEIPHILEHMVFDGSAKYTSADDLSAVFSNGGGGWNGVTTSYNTQFMFHNRVRNAKDVIDAACNMVFHPLLTVRSFDEEMQVVGNELQSYMGDFTLGADQYTQQQITPHLLVSTDSQLDRLPSINYKSVVAFYKKYYGTANTKIIVLCDEKQLPFSQLQRNILSATNGAPRCKRHHTPLFDTAKSDGIVYPVQVNKAISSSTLSLQYVIEGKASARTRAILHVFCTLASNMSSYSVNYKLRKMGLSYNTSIDSFHSSEVYGAEITLDAENNKFIKILAYTLSLIKELLNDGIEPKQFEQLKNEIIESIDDDEATTDGIMGWYKDDFLVTDTVESPQQYKKLIASLSQEEVLKLVGGDFFS